MTRDLILGQSLDVLIDHRGKTPAKLGSEFTTAGIPVASAILVRGGRLDLTAARHVSPEIYARWMRVPTRAGDVLLTSEAPLGRVARVLDDSPLVLGQRLFGLRGKAGILDSGFLFYALQTVEMQTALVGRSTGTTVLGIRQASLRELRIQAPDYMRQRAIAEVLGALDDKIAANATVLKCIAEMNTLLVAHASAAATPVDIASIASLITRGITPRYTVDSGWTVVNQKCIRDHRVDLGPARKSEPRSSALERLLRTDDLLVNSTGQGTLGRTARWTASTPDVTVDSHVTILRFDPTQVDPAFAGVAALPLDAQIELLAEGSTGQTELRRELLGALIVQLPTREVQQATGARIREHDDLELAVRDESARLATTRDALLPLLMSGRITVRDAEAAV